MERRLNALYSISTLVEKDVLATSLEKREPVARLIEEIMNVLLSLFWDQKFNI